MIQSLEEIAQRREFDRKRYGDKTVLLAEFLVDIDAQGFRCTKPFGYVVDTDEVDEKRLRETFDSLVDKIHTSIGGRKVGAIYCRSSAYQEYSGSNESVAVLYDERDPEQSWRNFQESFIRVRKQGNVKPVLLQNVVGDITQKERRVIRKVHEYEWPGLPSGKHPIDLKVDDLPEFQRITTEAIREALRRENVELPEYDTKNADGSSLCLELYVENGPHIDTLSLSSRWKLESGEYIRSMLFVIANPYIDAQGYSRNDENNFCDREGRVILKKGTVVSLGITEREYEYVIGQTNTAFVARSRDYLEPEMESVKRAWGLTSYLMGSNKEQSLWLKSMIIEYYDPKTGELEESINLGHDFRHSSTPRYSQRAYEVFSVRTGRIEVREDAAFVDTFPPPISGEVQRIARFYHDKLGVEVEIEGCEKKGQLTIFQITESPLPHDVISHLTEVPEDRVLYREEFGRGAINYFGHVIIKEDNNYKKVTEQFDREGIPYLVLGFDDTVTQERNFLYMATEGSICTDVIKLTGGNKKGFAMFGQHLWGIACQTTFNAAQNGRQGGMFYSDITTLMEKLRGHVTELSGVKVITGVHVEACREGMQMYTSS
ncbi:hypothetical protein HYW21_06405 [Candidatus Woesearchaeota archaeon]|nr:hypothetical protein [Candidatus Woesearchaeota archaeon]